MTNLVATPPASTATRPAALGFAVAPASSAPTTGQLWPRPTGRPGSTGAQGDPGVAGPTGAAGASTAVSADLPWVADAPATADYEFDRLTPATTLPTGWSWLNQSGATYNEELGAGRITVPTLAAAQQVVGIGRTVPSGDWVMTAKVAGRMTPQYSGWGIYLRNAANGQITTFGFYWGGAAGQGTDYVSAMNWSSATAYTGSDWATGIPLHPTDVRYFRIIKSGTNVQLLFSSDGRAWTAIAGAAAPPYPPTVDQVGFCAYAYATGGVGTVDCEWMRFRTTTTPTATSQTLNTSVISAAAPQPRGLAAAGTTGNASDAGHVHPQMRVAGAVSNASSGPFTTTTFGDTDLTATFPTTSGRRYRVQAVGLGCYSTVAGDYYQVGVVVNGTMLTSARGACPIASTPTHSYVMQVEFVGTGASTTVKIQAARLSGTGNITHYAGGTTAASFTVDEVGV